MDRMGDLNSKKRDETGVKPGPSVDAGDDNAQIKVSPKKEM